MTIVSSQQFFQFPYHGGGKLDRTLPRTLRNCLFTLLLLGATVAIAVAQSSAPPPPNPTLDPGGSPNIFYGSIPPNGQLAPVVVFIPGLRGTASDWWSVPSQAPPGSSLPPNDMYVKMYGSGFRTAFIDLNADHTPNDATIQQNAAVITSVLPIIAARYNVLSFYVVAHSKGNLDLQMAMMNPNILGLVRAVFTVACPCHGSELADWAAGPGKPIAQSLGLLTPGVLALQVSAVTQLRTLFDPVFASAGIPFYTVEGNTFFGNPITAVTGTIMNSLTNNALNDGLVTVVSAQLPASYAVDLGTVPANHFDTMQGDVLLPKIQPQLQGLNLSNPSFRKIANNGLGDSLNTWAWSMKWFNGKLYVGTGRAVDCLSLLSNDAANGTSFYIIGTQTLHCPNVPDIYSQLGAEIWQYTPETKTWKRVYKSPNTIPIYNAGLDSNGKPTIFVAREVGFRGMLVFQEKDGHNRLYVGSVNAGSFLEIYPPYDQQGWPAPDILYTDDGQNWNSVPSQPGTFMGNLGKLRTGSNHHARSVRGLESLGNRIFATVGDFTGVGTVIASDDNPSAGNNHWAYASPIEEAMPVWNITAFNNFLYVETGDQNLANNPGYGVYKIAPSQIPLPGAGPIPNWTPVVTNGGCETDPRYQAHNGLSMAVFKNQLYMGTNRPTELIRINPDDSWDLLVGQPRSVGPSCNTKVGTKYPLSGQENGFGNFFTGHFWRMAATSDTLYLTTWDWSEVMKFFFLTDAAFRAQYGFDAYSTKDGIHWTNLTRTGFNDTNIGGRTIGVTPYGVFIGSATSSGGFQIYQEIQHMDSNGDEIIDKNDVANLLATANTPAGAHDNATGQDLDGDGKITVLDARKLATQCDNQGCPSSSSSGSTAVKKIPPPANLRSASMITSPNTVQLSWDPSPGAVSYSIFKSVNVNVLNFIPQNLTITLPVIGTVQYPADVLSGKFDYLCNPNPDTVPCFIVTLTKEISSFSNSEDIGLPEPFIPVGPQDGVTTTSYQEPALAPPFHAIYFVEAIDNIKQSSDPSNQVEGTSLGSPGP